MALPGNIRDREYAKFTEVGGETAVRVTGSNASGSILADVVYDAVSTAYPNDTTEVYSFFQGGLSGTLQATITITYTDNTKNDLNTVVRS